MTILSKYIVREFSKVCAYSLAVALSLFLIFDLFERLDTFIKYRASFPATAQYFLFKLPSLVFQMTPMAVLLATCITFANLSRHSEIIALRASGISLYHLLFPILASTLIISIATFLGNELISPYANQKVQVILDDIKGQKRKYLFKQHEIWYRGEGMIYNIKFFSYQDNALHGVTVYFMDKSFHLYKRIDAERGHWDKNQWVFTKVTTRTFESDKKITTALEQQKVIPFKEGPDTFRQEARKPEVMSYLELKDYIEKTTNEGYDTTPYLADMYAKISSPFINFIISLLGIPFAIRLGRHGGFALGITLSIIIGFVYWVFFNVCLALGHGGALPPVISAWIANLIFGALGLYLLLRTPY